MAFGHPIWGEAYLSDTPRLMGWNSVSTHLGLITYLAFIVRVSTPSFSQPKTQPSLLFLDSFGENAGMKPSTKYSPGHRQVW